MAGIEQSKGARPKAGSAGEPEEAEFTLSSGNVFADLDLEEPEDLLQKSRFVTVIAAVIRKRRLTQLKAAEIMGISQPDLSKLLRAGLPDFRLIDYLGCLLPGGFAAH